MISHLPEEVNSTHYLLVQVFGVISDDTVFASGTAFVKTWRIRNSGSCDWTAGFSLVFVSGDQMGGEATVAVPPTAAGSTADLSVHLTAPSSPGTYRGNWRVQSDEGLAFGSIVYVQIVVAGAATEEPTGEPAGPTNLVATGRVDGSLRFTWNDAGGEAEYRYDFEIRKGTSGDRDTGTLPADTISWTSDDYPCGAEGDFTLQALAGDGGEIGEASVHFEMPDCDSLEWISLPGVDQRSGNMSTGGCSPGASNIRAGIAPAGNGIRGFASFDLSELDGVMIAEAHLYVNYAGSYELTGDPFGLIGPLHVEQIEFGGSLCGCQDCLDKPALVELYQLDRENSGHPYVTEALVNHLLSGDPDYFQVRLRWEHDDAGEGSASMIDCDGAALTVEYFSFQ